MREQLFDTQEKIEMAVNLFKSLLDNPGFQLYQKVFDNDIDSLTAMIIDGYDRDGSELTKDRTDMLREILKVYKRMRNYPEEAIVTFTEKKGENVTADPYYTVDELVSKTE